MGDHETPLHEQAAQFTRGWVEAERNSQKAKFPTHSGPAKGPIDFLLIFGFGGGFLGFLLGRDQQLLTAVVFAALGVGIIMSWRLLAFLLRRLGALVSGGGASKAAARKDQDKPGKP